LGLVDVNRLPPALGVLFLMCWVFAAFGVWVASLANSYEWFTYSQSGIITPMSLFCGTYFPLSRLPEALVYLAYALPLTHGLMSVRMFLAGDFNSDFVLNLGYLLFAGLVFTNVSTARLERKLVV